MYSASSPINASLGPGHSGDRPIKYPARRVRVLKAGWYGPSGAPVTVDDVIELPGPDAQGAIALGRVELVKD